MNELELRAQAAYGYVTQQLIERINECANLRAELAARDAQMQAVQEKLAAAEAHVAELTPKEPAGE